MSINLAARTVSDAFNIFPTRYDNILTMLEYFDACLQPHLTTYISFYKSLPTQNPYQNGKQMFVKFMAVYIQSKVNP